MDTGTRPVLGLITLLVLLPLLAVVIICSLLLFGVEPHLVFLPGHFLLARLQAVGVRAPKVVGLLTTVVVWWGLLVSVWLLLRRAWRSAT
jgi:hypothetical protein